MFNWFVLKNIDEQLHFLAIYQPMPSTPACGMDTFMLGNLLFCVELNWMSPQKDFITATPGNEIALVHPK